MSVVRVARITKSRRACRCAPAASALEGDLGVRVLFRRRQGWKSRSTDGRDGEIIPTVGVKPLVEGARGDEPSRAAARRPSGSLACGIVLWAKRLFQHLRRLEPGASVELRGAAPRSSRATRVGGERGGLRGAVSHCSERKRAFCSSVAGMLEQACARSVEGRGARGSPGGRPAREGSDATLTMEVGRTPGRRGSAAAGRSGRPRRRQERSIEVPIGRNSFGARSRMPVKLGTQYRPGHPPGEGLPAHSLEVRRSGLSVGEARVAERKASGPESGLRELVPPPQKAAPDYVPRQLEVGPWSGRAPFGRGRSAAADLLGAQ